jgi:hypothetical protein
MSKTIEFLKQHEPEIARILAPKMGVTEAAVASAIQSAHREAEKAAAKAKETQTPTE